MTMLETALNALRATGATVSRALGANGQVSEVRPSGGLTIADDARAIMVAGSPGRRVAGSPGRPTCVFMGPLSPASLPA